MAKERDSADFEELLLPRPSGEHVPRPPRRPWPAIVIRRQVLFCAAFALLSLVLVLFFFSPSSLHNLLPLPSVDDYEDPHSLLLGPPTQSFRENLRNDSKYITSWLSAGWTNDVMTFGNLIYLALITERIPIIPRFTPSHVGPDTPTIPFGHVFDVPRLSKALRIPILEWDRVKDVDSEVVDELGCWAVWPLTQNEENIPRRSTHPSRLKLDISYTRAPAWVKFSPPEIQDRHGSFWSLARLSFPEARAEAMSQPPEPSPEHQAYLPPDDQLLCYDYLYYMAVEQPWEWNWDYAPEWRFVGRHMHWNATLEKLALDHARRAMGVSDDESTPPFISIHMRRGDFRVYCKDVAEADCFPPLSAIADRVAEVQQELFDRKGISVTEVIMTSDERDPSWWAEVRDFGWSHVDFAAEQTVEKYGKWYPVLIDAVIQSRGAGFIGTYGSTMSTVAERRVQSWQDGAVRVIQWGWPGADDH